MPEGRISLFYVLLASIWIIGSDSLLSRISSGSASWVFLQSFKGLNFVITTGVLLYFVLRRAYGGWRRSEERRLTAMRSARERKPCAKKNAPGSPARSTTNSVNCSQERKCSSA